MQATLWMALSNGVILSPECLKMESFLFSRPKTVTALLWSAFFWKVDFFSLEFSILWGRDYMLSTSDGKKSSEAWLSLESLSHKLTWNKVIMGLLFKSLSPLHDLIGFNSSCPLSKYHAAFLWREMGLLPCSGHAWRFLFNSPIHPCPPQCSAAARTHQSLPFFPPHEPIPAATMETLKQWMLEEVVRFSYDIALN